MDLSSPWSSKVPDHLGRTCRFQASGRPGQVPSVYDLGPFSLVTANVFVIVPWSTSALAIEELRASRTQSGLTAPTSTTPLFRTFSRGQRMVGGSLAPLSPALRERREGAKRRSARTGSRTGPRRLIQNGLLVLASGSRSGPHREHTYDLGPGPSSSP